LNINFYEVFKEEREALKKALPSDVDVQYFSETIQELKGHQSAPLISIRTQSHVPSDWDGKVKAILSRSQGYDHLLKIKETFKSDIALGYLGSYCSRAVAEHVITVMFGLLKKLKSQINHFDDFNRDHLTGVQCLDKNALVVGVGDIGSEIANLLKGIQMNVKGVDIDKKVSNLDYVSLALGIAWADVIICALPLTEQTRGMLNFELLKEAKPSAILINISRGEITPMNDLKRLISENLLAGLALDVYENEKQLANGLRSKEQGLDEIVEIVGQLKDKENVIFTPHNAFNTDESTKNKAKLSADAFKQFLSHQSFPHQI